MSSVFIHIVACVRISFLFFFFFFLNFFYLFIYFWLCWVFVSVRGLSLLAASGGHSSSRCTGLSLSLPLLLQSTGSTRAGSAIVAHGPSRSAACGIFPDQGSNPCPLHWQEDSQPLCHQGSPEFPSFLRLNNIPLCVYTMFCLYLHLLMDTWVASTFWLLWIMLLWMWVYKFLFESSLSILLFFWVYTQR